MNNLLRKLNQRSIAFYPLYAEYMGSITGGILLSQLMYWFEHKDKYWKTDDELMAETTLTPNELRAVKLKLKQVEFLTITKEGIPAKTYYEIDWDVYLECLMKFTGTGLLNSQDTLPEINKTITKTTSKTTSKREKGDKSEQNKFFDRFWSLYPKKTTKKETRDYVLRMELNTDLTEYILDALQKQITVKAKMRERGEFTPEFPDPIRWLKKERWEDEIGEPEPTDRKVEKWG